jgi:hypothetical protein
MGYTGAGGAVCAKAKTGRKNRKRKGLMGLIF